jgi:hypothetical protein
MNQKVDQHIFNFLSLSELVSQQVSYATRGQLHMIYSKWSEHRHLCLFLIHEHAARNLYLIRKQTLIDTVNYKYTT